MKLVKLSERTIERKRDVIIAKRVIFLIYIAGEVKEIDEDGWTSYLVGPGG